MNALCPNLMVNDMAKSVDFYTNVLGFEVEMSVPEEAPYQWVMLANDAAMLMLQTRQSLGADVPALADQPTGGSFSLYIDVDDIDEMYDDIKDSVTIVKELAVSSYQRKEFTIADPDGYILMFSQGIEE